MKTPESTLKSADQAGIVQLLAEHLSFVLCCEGRTHCAAKLASSPGGRMALHLVCLIRHPARFRWHWSGILRELTP